MANGPPCMGFGFGVEATWPSNNNEALLLLLLLLRGFTASPQQCRGRWRSCSVRSVKTAPRSHDPSCMRCSCTHGVLAYEVSRPVRKSSTEAGSGAGGQAEGQGAARGPTKGCLSRTPGQSDPASLLAI